MRYQTMSTATTTSVGSARPSVATWVRSLKPTAWISTPNVFDVRETNAHAADGPGGLP